MLLERLLQSQGFGSRRECRALIRAGAVAVAGTPVDDPFCLVEPDGLVFSVAGEAWLYRHKAYLMLHKPPGYECSHQTSHHPSVYALLPPELRRRGVQSVGRLDADSSGLLLFSDDGQFIHAISSGKRQVEKTYRVRLKHPLAAAQQAALLAGVTLRDSPLPVRATACEALAADELALTVTEGRYHQVKRMLAAVGNRVVALHRTAIGGLALPDDLPPGTWRWLAEADLARLQER